MEFESKLTNDQWLGGQQPGAADREALATMTGPPSVKDFPHTFAWWCLASKFTPAVQASWTAGAAKTAAKPAAAKKDAKPEAKKAAADDCDDLFGEETEEDKAAAAESKKKAEEAKEKKDKAKPAVIAKSIIVWEVKPYSSDIDLDYLGKRILAIKMDGLVWKT